MIKRASPVEYDPRTNIIIVHDGNVERDQDVPCCRSHALRKDEDFPIITFQSLFIDKQLANGFQVV
ncbi:hypothetical protein B5K11_26250 [Rhizobium leguminosarum bv. trifolii]|nr:hypothetical protein B5K11_26250 [Rhizobium leguminosarum bv. trifolii]